MDGRSDTTARTIERERDADALRQAQDERPWDTGRELDADTLRQAQDERTWDTERGADPRAVEVASALRAHIDAERVILFGSRCRDDWTDRSDVDLMVIEPEQRSVDERIGIKKMAQRIADNVYAMSEDANMGVDVVFMTSEEYERKSLRTINNVAAIAREEGILMTRNSGIHGERSGDDDNRDQAEEYAERAMRIADANMHYNTMQVLLDAGVENKNAVYHAHQTLEHALKALISAMGRRYPHIHELTGLTARIRELNPSLRSDLSRLDSYVGRERYGPIPDPVTDFAQMANEITGDLEDIHGQIARLTGEDPWSVPPDGATDPVRPRRR